MTRKIVKYACAVIVAGLLSSAAQASTTKDWSGSDAFNDQSITFTGFTANQLTSISGDGTYEAATQFSAQCHCETGVLTNFSLLIRLNNVWTDIKDWSTSNTSEQLLSSLLTPITFATGTVSGIELTSNPNGSSFDPSFNSFNYWTWWDGSSSESFTFDNKVTVTPLPATLPLFAGGVGFLGFLARRRKQKA